MKKSHILKFFGALVLSFVFFPGSLHAASSVVWGSEVYDEHFELVSDDRIFIQDGGSYGLPLNVEKPISIDFDDDLFDMYGKIYRMENGNRTFVVRIGFGGVTELAWTEIGNYEVDMFDAGEPILSRRGFWDTILALFRGNLAYAFTNELLETKHFEIKDANLVDEPPTLTLLPEELGVVPLKGTPLRTEFIFTIVYSDLENIAPAFVTVDVAGIPHEMAVDSESASSSLIDGNYTNGEQYTAAVTIAEPGAYGFSFSASDGVNVVSLISSSTISVGYSNIAFLPGVQSSHLYRDGLLFEDELWLPNLGVGADDDLGHLFMDQNGNSVESGIYTRDEDVIYSAYGNLPVYDGFDIAMNELVSAGDIVEWKPLAYDWRLGIDSILEGGAVESSKISYIQDTTEPYIVSELSRLADSSRSGKVTIIAHSNGGLIAKALLKKLEDSHDPLYEKIDLVILVAVPQLGTPKALLPLLHGAENPLGTWMVNLDDETWRAAARNAPGALNLLPSEAYFNETANVESGPIFSFTDKLDALAETIRKRDIDHYIGSKLPPVFDYRSRYGSDIQDYAELVSFLTGEEGRREPDYSDTIHPIVLRSALLDEAKNLHDELDSWTPADFDNNGEPDVRIVQIVGWGVPTIRGIEYGVKQHLPACLASNPNQCISLYGVQATPLYTTLGDGTVVVSSADVMDAETYYFDVLSYNDKSPDTVRREHANILAAETVTETLHSLVLGSDVSNTQFLSDTAPSNNGEPFTLIEMHSPVALEVTDKDGNRLGLTTDTQAGITYVEENIPNSSYLEVSESKFIALPTDGEYTVKLDGLGAGTFTLKVKRLDARGVLLKETSFSNVPVTNALRGEFTISPTIEPKNLALDTDGNGVVDKTVASDGTPQTPSDLLKEFRRVLAPMTMAAPLKKTLVELSLATEKLLDAKHPLLARVSVLALETVITQKKGKGILVSDATTLLNLLSKIKASLK